MVCAFYRNPGVGHLDQMSELRNQVRNAKSLRNQIVFYVHSVSNRQNLFFTIPQNGNKSLVITFRFQYFMHWNNHIDKCAINYFATNYAKLTHSEEMATNGISSNQQLCSHSNILHDIFIQNSIKRKTFKFKSFGVWSDANWKGVRAHASSALCIQFIQE